ncbi:MAG: DUF952 domain-containing protein [Parvularculaceae bacterium]|nr:DUF952 domain-containing protein [Parvularculaceae bacterium]
MALVFKIMSEADFARGAAGGFVPPAPVDRADGFIHLSAEDQVLETARLYFAGRDDLVAVAFDAQTLGPALQWEASRGGALFPHYYDALAMRHARQTRRLVRRADGTFDFGEALS